MLTRRALVLALGSLPTAAHAQRRFEPARLSDADRADLQRIEAYLNGLRTLEARFLQLGESGAMIGGRFSLQRPGRMRFEYDAPSQIVMISDGAQLLYDDLANREHTIVPLSQTPLAAFSADRLGFGTTLIVTRFERLASAFAVTVRQASDPAQGELTLQVTDRPLTLQSWVVVDAQNIATRVALTSLSPNIPIPADRFDVGPYAVRALQGRRRD
jgi:outer membrane lipoprotein-sorting protein